MNAAPSGQRADLTPLHDETLRSIEAVIQLGTGLAIWRR